MPTRPDPRPLTYGSILNILMGKRRPLFHIQKESPMGNKGLVCFPFSCISWSNKKYCLCWTRSAYILRALQLLMAQRSHRYNTTVMITQPAYQGCSHSLAARGDRAGLPVRLHYPLIWGQECVPKAGPPTVPAHHPAHTRHGDVGKKDPSGQHRRDDAHQEQSSWQPTPATKEHSVCGANQRRYEDKPLQHAQGWHRVLTSRCLALQLQPCGPHRVPNLLHVVGRGSGMCSINGYNAAGWLEHAGHGQGPLLHLLNYLVPHRSKPTTPDWGL